MNTTELSQLRAMLPRGSRLKIQKATNFSISYIDLVLKGKRFNAVILNAALEIVREEQLTKKSTSTKFQQIISIL